MSPTPCIALFEHLSLCGKDGKENFSLRDYLPCSVSILWTGRASLQPTTEGMRLAILNGRPRRKFGCTSTSRLLYVNCFLLSILSFIPKPFVLVENCLPHISFL